MQESINVENLKCMKEEIQESRNEGKQKCRKVKMQGEQMQESRNVGKKEMLESRK